MLHEPLPESGRKKAIFLTLLVHLALVVALFVGVQWKTRHEAVEVELWSGVPPSAAVGHPLPETSPELPKTPEPPKIQPPDPPKPPDIAVRVEKPEKPPEPKREEPPKPPPKAQQRPPSGPDFKALQAAADREIINRQRESTISELRNAATPEGAFPGGAAARKSAVDAWIDKITAKIRGNVVLPLVIEGNPEAVILVSLLPSGEVFGQPRLRRSSGNTALDEAIERAILKSSPFPKPEDSSVFAREIEIRYRPFDG